MWNKLAKQDEILLRKKNNEVFGRLFVQCFANVWPTGCQSPQMARFVLPNANTLYLTY